MRFDFMYLINFQTIKVTINLINRNKQESWNLSLLFHLGLIIESEIDSEEKFLSMGAEKHSKVVCYLVLV